MEEKAEGRHSINPKIIPIPFGQVGAKSLYIIYSPAALGCVPPGLITHLDSNFRAPWAPASGTGV
jgi:hypothetical protein